MAITRKQAEEEYQKKLKEYVEVIEKEIDELLVEHLSRMKEAGKGYIIILEGHILRHLTDVFFDWNRNGEGKIFLESFSSEDIFNILKEKYKEWKFEVTEFELNERGHRPESRLTFYLPDIPEEKIKNSSKVNRFEVMDMS